MTTEKKMVVVELICLKVNGRLRVRIVSANYNTSLNCQFPHDLRYQNRKFTTSSDNITLITGKSRDYYIVKRRGDVRIVSNDHLVAKIYGEKNEPCCVCLDSSSYYVIVPCGHYCICESCTSFKSCPLCRTPISQIIARDKLKF